LLPAKETETTTSTTTATAHFFNGTTDGEGPHLNFATGASNISPLLEKSVVLHDFRDLSPAASLSTLGCEFVHAPTTLFDSVQFQGEPCGTRDTPAAVLEEYRAECAALVQARTGCSRAIAYHHRQRFQKQPTAEEEGKDADPSSLKQLIDDSARRPVALFHVDNDAITAEWNLRRTVGDEEAEREWLGTTESVSSNVGNATKKKPRRWGIINVWRPLGNPIKQWPLALVRFDSSAGDSLPCLDENETNKADPTPIVPIKTFGNWKSHFLSLGPPKESSHTFYYASEMQPDEALLFIDFDSEAERAGRVSGVGHGAVRDHNSAAGAPLRCSIEVRVLVLYDD
jgi:hypothetical protein